MRRPWRRAFVWLAETEEARPSGMPGRAERQNGCRSACAALFLDFVFAEFDEFDARLGGVVADAVAEAQDAGVAAGPLGISGGDGGKEGA